MKQDIKDRIEHIKKGQVPQGYKTTKLGIIPQEWEVAPMSKIFKEVSNKIGNQNIETYSITAGIGFVSQKEKFGKDISSKQNENYILLEKGCFSYNKGNSKTYNYGCIYLNEKGTIAVPNVFISFKPLKNNISSVFYVKLFENHFLDRGLRQIISSSARMDGLLNVNKESFFKLNIPNPELKEQSKIASILSTWDTAIEKQEKLIELKKEQKKWLMQELLTGKKRLKGFSGEWEKKYLGELCEITTGKLDANAMVENGEYYFFTCAKEAYRIDKYAFDTEALLISGNGANVGYIHYYKGKFNAYQRTYVLTNFFNDIIYNKYVLDKYLEIRINKEKNDGNTPYIKLDTLSKMKINLPSIQEQKAIAEILSTADKEIDLLEKELGNIKEQKKGLMQLLLTGIVRV